MGLTACALVVIVSALRLGLWYQGLWFLQSEVQGVAVLVLEPQTQSLPGSTLNAAALRDFVQGLGQWEARGPAEADPQT